MHGGDIANGRRCNVVRHLFALLLGAALLAACKPPPDPRYSFDRGAAKRGHTAIERAGCGACHEIPGVGWPGGHTGPSLADFGDRGVIAGTVPNRPDLLAAFIRNAPAVKPGSPMPPMPVSDSESRDIAAYLYQAGQ